MKRPTLFREEALQEHQSKWVGEIILIRPISFFIFTFFAFAIALVIVLFLIFGTYTKRSTVQGQLIPDSGLMKVYAPETGVILEKYVQEGQSVRKNDVLYVLSTTRYGLHGDIQETIATQVRSRTHSLEDERTKSRTLHQAEYQQISKKISSLQTDLGKINNLIENQKQRVNLAQESIARYADLLRQDYISKELLQSKKEEFLDQQSRLQSLDRDKLSILNQLDHEKISLSSLGTKQQNEVAQLDRAIASTNQELTESQARQKIVIKANQSGTVALLSADLGQQIDQSIPLLSIVPQNSHLIAQLYVPSSAIGFIKTGDRVNLRYQAYPYQKFGHATGIVSSISKTALPSREINTIGSFSETDLSGGQPTYVVKVKLNKQSITAYGNEQVLQTGMALEADVMHEKRKLYEWVLEPLFSISGKI